MTLSVLVELRYVQSNENSKHDILTEKHASLTKKKVFREARPQPHITCIFLVRR